MSEAQPFRVPVEWLDQVIALIEGAGGDIEKISSHPLAAIAVQELFRGTYTTDEFQDIIHKLVLMNPALARRPQPTVPSYVIALPPSSMEV